MIKMTEFMKLYKLMIMYMLNKVSFPLTNSQLTSFFMNRGYLTYFKLQQALSELAANDFVSTETTHRRTFYTLTEEGAKTLSYFRGEIPSEFRTDMDQFLSAKEYELREETSVKSDYTLNGNREYSVRCRILEQGEPLIELSVTAPSETSAQMIADNWQRKSQEVYAQVMGLLLSE